MTARTGNHSAPYYGTAAQPARTLRLENPANGAVLLISRHWIGNRWEVVISDGVGRERSRRGFPTVRDAVAEMAEKARQWVSEQA
jgi:hypothetical protein